MWPWALRLGMGLLKWTGIGSGLYTAKDYLTGSAPKDQSFARTAGGNVGEVLGDAWDFTKGVFSGNQAQPSVGASVQPGGGTTPGAGLGSGQGMSQAPDAISGIFNNFSDTKIGQAMAPLMGFLRSSPIISGILTVVFGMMALSGQNSWPMRIFAGGIAATLATQSGILDSVTQGGGRNTPAVGGADSYSMQPPRSQPHAGGPVSSGPGYEIDDREPDYSLSGAYEQNKLKMMGLQPG